MLAVVPEYSLLVLFLLKHSMNIFHHQMIQAILIPYGFHMPHIAPFIAFQVCISFVYLHITPTPVLLSVLFNFLGESLMRKSEQWDSDCERMNKTEGERYRNHYIFHTVSKSTREEHHHGKNIIYGCRRKPLFRS